MNFRAWVRERGHRTDRRVALLGVAAAVAAVLTTAGGAAAAGPSYPVNVGPGQTLEVRNGPGTEYNVVQTLHNGDLVEIRCTALDTAGNVWDKIARDERWVPDERVKTGTDSPVGRPCGTDPVAGASNTFPVRTDSGKPVNVRSGPSVDFDVVGVIRSRETVTIRCTGRDSQGGLWTKSRRRKRGSRTSTSEPDRFAGDAGVRLRRGLCGPARSVDPDVGRTSGGADTGQPRAVTGHEHPHDTRLRLVALPAKRGLHHR